MRRTLVSIFVGLAVGLSWPGTSHAFPDKDITFIIPYTAGGGFDRTVRALAPYMEKYLPKKVNVVPRNVAGAGAARASPSSSGPSRTVTPSPYSTCPAWRSRRSWARRWPTTSPR